MNRKFLGDSYDAVKRMWGEMFFHWAPLYAVDRYIPLEMQEDFTQLTGIPILNKAPDSPYSILNDPDTGIRMPDEKNQRSGRTHTTIIEISNQLKEYAPQCIVTFDQSNYRNRVLNHQKQRAKKVEALRKLGVASFYYVSHAPFLFAFSSNKARIQLKVHLIKCGIPKSRFEIVE
jgi:hypothetical protein